MNLDLFMLGSGLRPTQRWQDAFPKGLCVDLDGVMPSLDASDVIWLSAALPQWQARLAVLGRENPGAALAVVSSEPDDVEALAAFEAGARGYCHAFATPAMLQEVSLVLRHGGWWIGPALMARVLTRLASGLPASLTAGPAERSVPDPLVYPALSSRESEVAREVVDGLSNREIAWKLGVTERTVKAHLGAIFAKLDVRDRLQLALKMAGALPTKGNGES